MGDLSAYSWMIYTGAFAAFLYGFGTGSNDVANAFGTSVGSKALTLRQAVVIAAIFEFTGAMVLGRVSTSTIAGGIADINAFTREPEFYAYGMLCSLTVAGIWQVLSSYLSFNTSSTHSIIGSIVGFSLVYAGSTGVLWYVPDTGSFPPYKGLVTIVIAWFFSPIFCAISSAFLFLGIRTAVLRRSYAYKGSFYVLPPFVFLVFFLCLYFVFTKGAKKSFQADDSSWTDNKALWIAACCGAGMALLSLLLLPFIMYKANKKFHVGTDTMITSEDEDAAGAKQAWNAADEENNGSAPAAVRVDPLAKPEGKETFKARCWRYCRICWAALNHGVDVDIFQVVEDDPLIAKIHAHAEVFSPKVEFVFAYLQVFSACCVIFAHGAGEVGYMAGPLGTIVDIVQTGTLQKNVTPILWTVAVGATGLVVGLATYGYNVVRAMGVRLAKLSPTRGFCAEISTAFVILIASQYGLPTSSSQVITGGIIGVGLCEGVMGVNWNFFAVQFGSWVGTIFVCGLGTAALFSAGAFAPCMQMADTILTYEEGLVAHVPYVAKALSATLKTFNASAQAGLIPNLSGAQLNNLVKLLNAYATNIAAEAGRKVQTANPDVMLRYLFQTLSIYQNQTVLSYGQTAVYPGALLCNDVTTLNTSAVCPAPVLVPPVLFGYA